MNDVRILTLCKQHYLDKYKKPLKTRFTCLGYYDGIDIECVEQNTNEKIAETRGCVSISELWYGSGIKTKKLEGGYSHQNIGLFRSPTSDGVSAEEYWKQESLLPFFAVGFLKLVDDVQFDEIGSGLEQFSKGGNRSKEQVCQVIAYCTYDNADLIILAKSNNFKLLQDTFEAIEDKDEVLYLHSIVGVEEDYLLECKNRNIILNVWKETVCYIEDTVEEINLQMVSGGPGNLLPRVKKLLHEWNQKPWHIEGYEKIRYSYIMGHANISITIPQTNIATLLTLLLPEGFITHQNDAYNYGLYNIESSISLRDNFSNSTNETTQYTKEPSEKNVQNSRYWCEALIEKYREFFNEELITNDESMYSYYQALIKTLNTLDQYERFAMSRDIFNLIFPSFQMFDKKLESALICATESKDYTLLERVKMSLCEYIEFINSIIYHTIHTDQVYLMIPGYSGTSFSIPIKLSLFYQWFVGLVAETLNDNKRKFACIITPVMEAKPQTKMIETRYDDQERLICIKLSQRSLFFPRNLMVILTHELGHYIGREMRCREARLKYILRTMVYFLAEAICPEDFQENEPSSEKRRLCDAMRESIRPKLQEEIFHVMSKAIDNTNWEKEYHASNISKQICKICRDVVSDTGIGSKIVKNIHVIPEQVIMLLDQEEKYVDNMRYIAGLMNKMEENRKQLLTSGVIEVLVTKLIRIYREIFSDLAALAILGCTQDDYFEAFRVSEGVSYLMYKEPSEHWLRKRVVQEVCFGVQNHIGEAPDRIAPSKQRVRDCNKNKRKHAMERLSEDAYLYVWVYQSLFDYAKKCNMKMQSRLQDSGIAELVEKTKHVFNMFTSENVSCNQIYAQVIQSINEYRRAVKARYDACLNDINS